MIAFQLEQLHYAKRNKINTAKHKTGTVEVSVANINNIIIIIIIIIIQGVPGGMCQTSGECSLGQTIPI